MAKKREVTGFSVDKFENGWMIYINREQSRWGYEPSEKFFVKSFSEIIDVLREQIDAK